MPDHSKTPANEGLLAPSAVRLFGREFSGLTLAAGADAKRLARIYGFTFEGHYHPLSAPAILVVEGEGTAVPAGDAAIPLDVLGAAATKERFADGTRMWLVDRLDQITRIEIATGWVDDLVLQPELDAAELDARTDIVGRTDMVGRTDLTGRPRRR